MTDHTTPKPLGRELLTRFTPPVDGTLIALCIPWEGSPSGCVEWRLVDWTVTDDDGQSFPIWADVAGDTGAWGSDYALRGPQDSDWCFPDGERCDDANLAATFERRRAGASSPPPGRAQAEPPATSYRQGAAAPAIGPAARRGNRGSPRGSRSRRQDTVGDRCQRREALVRRAGSSLTELDTR